MLLSFRGGFVLQTLTPTRSERPIYQVHDRISIPEDVPALEVTKGDEGIIRDLVLHNDKVTAFVEVSHSTGQTKGWVFARVMPEKKVLSHTLEG